MLLIDFYRQALFDALICGCLIQLLPIFPFVLSFHCTFGYLISTKQRPKKSVRNGSNRMMTLWKDTTDSSYTEMISNQHFPHSQIHFVCHGCGEPELGLCPSDALTGSIVGVRLPSGVGWALGTDPGPWHSQRRPAAQDQLKA